MIDAQALSVRYAGTDRDALSSVTLTAAPGQLTALVGPNGCGKSTFVRALLGRAPVTGGDLRLGGVLISALSATARARQLAVVIQREEPAFPMVVQDYIGLGRHPWRRTWAPLDAADHHGIDRAIEDADVRSITSRRTDTLSGGEWQRVRIARALAQEATTLVLDEPTTFLDIAHEMDCFELLASLARRGRAVLVVSHQLNLVARFADQVALLSAGSLAALGTPSTVMRGEVLEHVYRWPLVVTRDPAVGAPTLVPLRRHR